MLLRICLIVALLGGIAAGVVNFVYVKQNLVTVIADRDDQTKQKVAAQDDAKKTHKALDDTKAKLDSTTKELGRTKGQLDAANSQVADLTQRNGDLDKRLKDTQLARENAEAELSKWQQLHITPLQVKQVIEDLKTRTTERDNFVAENQILNKKLIEVKAELAALIDPGSAQPLPPGLRGKIVAVDPKFDFVVLNIGDDKGVVKRGVMMVARDGKLLGKVQITRVDKDESIANLLPGWTRGEVKEGDEVIY